MDGWKNTNKKDKEYSSALSRLEDVLWIFFSVQLIKEALRSINHKKSFNFPLEFLLDFNLALQSTVTQA